MDAIIVGLIGAIISVTGVFSYGQYSQTFGALPLIQSAQLAASPTNGLVLKTDGTSNYWGTDDGGAGSGLSSYDAFTHPISGVSATTSTLRLGGLNASSTVLFDNATSTLFTATTAWLTNLFIGADTLAENISDTAGAMFSGNTETGVTATYQDADNTIDVECDTASGSVFGCLSTTDWTTFNTKLSNYDAWTHPATGVSASTSSFIFTNSSSTFTGNLTITGNATATNATTTTFYNSGQTRLGALASSLVLSGSTGILSNYTGITCTNQLVEDVSAAGAGTCVSINNGYWSGTDLSVANGGTGLSTFGGTNTILYTTAADTLSSEAAFTYDPTVNLLTADNTVFVKATTTNLLATGSTTLQNFTAKGATTTNATTTTLYVSSAFNLFGTVYTTLAALGNALVNAVTAVTPTGTWDFGGATSVEIPNGTAPTVDATGEVAVDTTAGQFAYYDGVADRRLMATTTKSFNIASTTLDALGKSFSLGTTTFTLMNSGDPLTLLGFYCQASTTGTAIIRFGDGVNWTTEQVCTSGAYTVTTSNNTFTAFEPFMLQASSTIGTTNRITVTPHFRFTSQ